MDPSRGAILREAASLAVTDGLAGLSIGSVAAALGIPKSGLRAHFRSATELQLATVTEAARIFAEEVMQPALAVPPGLSALTAVCEAFFAYLERQTFPGGCFLASAALEMGVRPGPVSELLAEIQARFGALIRGSAATAVEQNELPGDEDPDRLAFELNGIMLATDTNFVLHDDPAVLDLARQIVRQRLGDGAPQPG
jgi:AcrR family transcriptional regulator